MWKGFAFMPSRVNPGGMKFYSSINVSSGRTIENEHHHHNEFIELGRTDRGDVCYRWRRDTWDYSKRGWIYNLSLTRQLMKQLQRGWRSKKRSYVVTRNSLEAGLDRVGCGNPNGVGNGAHAQQRGDAPTGVGLGSHGQVPRSQRRGMPFLL